MIAETDKADLDKTSIMADESEVPTSTKEGEGDVEALDKGGLLDEEAEEEGGLLDKGATMITEAVHPKLTELPRCAGLSIAAWTILSNLAFLAFMTTYNFYWNCRYKLSILDTEWQTDDGFDVYEEQFNNNMGTFLCASYVKNYYPSYSFFNKSCILNGLDCSHYGNGRCPVHFDCGVLDPVADDCGRDPDGLASVVAVDCMTFFASFGAAIAPVAYVQTVAFLIGYAIYMSCSKENKKDTKSMAAELQALAKSTFAKMK